MRDSQLVYIIHLATETCDCVWEMNKRSILRDRLWTRYEFAWDWPKYSYFIILPYSSLFVFFRFSLLYCLELLLWGMPFLTWLSLGRLVLQPLCYGASLIEWVSIKLEPLQCRLDLRRQNLTSVDLRLWLRPYIYGFKHIWSQIICHWNG